MAAESPLTFVLVHGAWHGGWCWDRLNPVLGRSGAVAIAPTLSGMGDRFSPGQTGINLDTHATDVIAALEQAPGKAVLVGHSYAGVVITLVADRRPDLIHELVYLDALLVEPGESIASRWLSPEDRGTMEARHAAGDAAHPCLPPEAFDILDPTDAAWVSSKLTPHPAGSYLQPLELAHSFGNGLPKHFVFFTEASSPLAGSQRHRLPGGPVHWLTADLAVGHDAMISDPDRLAECLLRITQRNAQAGE